MKLGNVSVLLEPESALAAIYAAEHNLIQERHRSKYSFDRRYGAELSGCGLKMTAFAQDGMTEAFEWDGHPWGIGVQFHPEFVSKPSRPHPLFTAFVRASLDAAAARGLSN